MKKNVIKITIFMVLLIATVSIATPTHWRVLAPGLEYTKITLFNGLQQGSVHAFKINLKNYNLELALAKDNSNQHIATVRDLAEARGAIIGVNGGFFSQELKPLGLRIDQNQIKNPLKATKWWSVFYIANSIPHIVSQQVFKNNPNVSLAIQSGPRLVIDGQIPNLKKGIANRSALGISNKNEVILLATENLNLTTNELARIMRRSQKDGGLECENAINLDGGSSTQLFADIHNFKLNVFGINAVTDAILVTPKQNQEKAK